MNGAASEDHHSVDAISSNTTNTSGDAAEKLALKDTEGHGAIVAAHYNALEEKGLVERNKSRIVHLRNFNNWIKSMLINEYMDAVKDNRSVGTPIRVLDMCCGKGGDLLKWRNSNIRHLVCADIAATSVEQCQSRYEDMRQRQRRERQHSNLFSAEFFVADCTKERLRGKYKDVTLQLDLVSCQFSFHYCFESLPQADCMLRNAAECLRPGGYFIGTMPDANDIVARYRANGCTTIENPVYKIEFEKNDEVFPLFGAKYNFSLKDVVDCPEFLVHFPTLERLARRHGLELVSKCRFDEYYEKNKEKGRGLLGRMQAFETYPPFQGESLSGEEVEYSHAKEYLEGNKAERIGTLSQPEWEAASLYMVFAFRKMKPVTTDDQGKPVYEVNVSTSSEVLNTSLKRSTEEIDANELKSKKLRNEDTEKDNSSSKRLQNDNTT